MDEEKNICNPYHTVNGIVPEAADFQFDNIVCDCGRIKFKKINTCGCAANPTWELQSTPNE
jgi:hypothetical protein